MSRDRILSTLCSFRPLPIHRSPSTFEIFEALENKNQKSEKWWHFAIGLNFQIESNKCDKNNKTSLVYVSRLPFIPRSMRSPPSKTLMTNSIEHGEQQTKIVTMLMFYWIDTFRCSDVYNGRFDVAVVFLHHFQCTSCCADACCWKFWRSQKNSYYFFFFFKWASLKSEVCKNLFLSSGVRITSCSIVVRPKSSKSVDGYYWPKVFNCFISFFGSILVCDSCYCGWHSYNTLSIPKT